MVVEDVRILNHLRQMFSLLDETADHSDAHFWIFGWRKERRISKANFTVLDDQTIWYGRNLR